jgi:NADP-dependent 3-hydroxy acid dehydrogenase YdfG
MDKVILITGASSGIGKETAIAAAAAGFRVALAARSVDKLESLVEQLGGTQRALAISCDVKSENDQKAMVDAVNEHFGQLDAVFANAGRGGSPGGFSSAEPSQWKDMLLTNVYGVGLTIQHCLPLLRESRGHVLLTGSIAGRMTVSGSMYSASKWAVTAIGSGLREELSGTGISVTLIQPGMVDTPFFDQPPSAALQPADIANAVIYALAQPKHVDVSEIVIQPSNG